MEIKEMQMSDIEARKAEIRDLVPEATEQQIADLNTELDALEERAAAIKEAAETRSKVVERLKEGAGETVIEMEKREVMEEKIITRNSPEYIEAFEHYVRTGDATECRSLLTENATNGTVAVPEFVYDIVKTAWEDNKLMRLVRKVEVKGILKVNFEISGSDATKHTEGGAAVSEETLTLGIATLVPAMFKKWIGISREAYSLRGEAFLRYIYDELAHRIVAKVQADLIAQIATLGTTASSTAPAAASITDAPDIDTVAQALAQLSAEAAKPVVVMNRSTWGAFKAAQYAGNFSVDPFEGLDVVFDSSMKAYSAASTGDVYAIVGDFGYGAIANFPNGDDVHFIFDEYTQKKADMVEVLGEQYVAVAPVAMNAFTRIKK